MNKINLVTLLKHHMYVDVDTYKNRGEWICDQIKLKSAKVFIHYCGDIDSIHIKCGNYELKANIHIWKGIPLDLTQYEAESILHRIYYEFSKYDEIAEIPEYNPTGDKHGDFIVTYKGMKDLETKKWVIKF